MDHKTLGEIFQEIIVEFSEMDPTTMDQLESKVQEAIRRLSEGLMEWKLNEWNERLQKRECSECGSKLENHSRSRQIATLVADISYQRCRSSCPDCGKVEYPKVEYPLDEALSFRIAARTATEQDVRDVRGTCSVVWCIVELPGIRIHSEYIMQKLLSRRLSHETIFNKTTEAGKAAASEFEGSKIKELEYDKKVQGDYFDNFDNMEVSKKYPRSIQRASGAHLHGYGWEGSHRVVRAGTGKSRYILTDRQDRQDRQTEYG